MIRQPESKSALKRKKRHRRRALRIAFLVSHVILVMFAVVMLVAFALQKTGWLPESSSAGSSAPPAATTTPDVYKRQVLLWQIFLWLPAARYATLRAKPTGKGAKAWRKFSRFGKNGREP